MAAPERPAPTAPPAPADIASGRAPAGSGLVRSLTHRQTTMIGLGSALGTGLFLGSGSAISAAGPAAIISYAIGAVLVAIIAVLLGEMSAAHPVQGSFGVIAHKYLGAWAGFVTRWMYWFSAVVVIGTEVVASALYIRWWWPGIPMTGAILAVAAVVLAVNIINVKSFGTTEFWLSTVKVTALCAFILCAAFLVFFGLPDSEATGFAHLTDDGGFMPHGVKSLWIAMSVVMFAYAGFEVVAIASAEAADPQRTIRTAMRQLAWRLSVFYVLSITLVMALIPWRRLAAGDGSVESSPFVRVFSDVGVSAAATLTNLVVLIAAISAANAHLYGASRLLHSLGDDGLAPAPLGRLTSRGVPATALAASTLGIAVAALLAFYDVGGIFTILMSIALFAVLLVWLLILASYVAFRRHRDANPADFTGFSIPGGAKLAVVAAVGVLTVAATAVEVPDMRQAAGVGLAFTVVLLAAYALIATRRKRA
ncbi:gamma-aminobutyrate permease [Streptomyces subrutilus]|uniref:Amino acid permease n=1 Tax=Streptomyces subrutilus TaxID=36818 RepID=A0A5P2UQJ8_9ACTN|nr:amino acid permease [Streptomyces subrutilus]QEU81616.1 amino acid permease [Streptomyces subrutilus]GGZ81212.1 gamma-aminobutyrate permease [Streptomyces subrutilus]